MPDLPKDRVSWLALLRQVERAFTSRADAEDALQSAYVRLEEYRRRVVVENPSAFLVRSTLNVAVDKRRRSKVRGEAEDREGALAGLVDEAPLQDAALLARQRLALVRAALDQLTPRTRDIFLMSRVDELEYAQIAARLGISVSAVEKHMAKAVQHLTRARRRLG